MTLIGLVLTMALLFPLYWMVISSLETNQEIFRIPAPLVPAQITFSGYMSAFTTQIPNLVTSLIIALGTVVLSLLIATPAAYALAHFRMRLTVVVVFALLLTQMIPTVTLSTPMFLIFNKLYLLNSYFGLILADSTYAVPFDILIMSAYFQSLPYELVEAAFVDGTNEWGAFLRVMLPLGAAGIITAGLFAFLYAWGDFLYALTLTTTNTIQPISLSIYNYLGQYESQWNGVMAVATLSAIPAALLLIFFQRYITAGVTSGALKG
ncbi:MAG TPA: carbohydrate ABC transporter permease [Ktedonobacterales bacterium]|nr:carbohydrate ABC transporter permease [Ktedonobacterales bacterium]